MGIPARGLMLFVLLGASSCFDDDDCSGFLDPTTNRCYEPDGDGDKVLREAPKKPGRLLAVDLATRDVIAIRDDGVGSGRTLDQPIAIELSSDRRTAYVADGGAILSVDLDDGFTQLVSDAGRGSGILLQTPIGLEWDLVTRLLLVHDAGLELVIALDTTNGDRFESPMPFAPESTEAERRITDPSAGLEYIVFRKR